MNFFNFITKILLYTFIFIGICNSSFAKTNNFNYDAKNISNYFSGLVSFDNFEYEDSREFLKKIQGLENTNKNYSSKYIQSLVNLEKYREAYLYSKRLDTRNMGNFESNLIICPVL